MREQFLEKLMLHPRKRVKLEELELWVQGFGGSYTDLANLVLASEETGQLVMVKSKGRNGRLPSVAYEYTIAKHLLRVTFHQQLNKARTSLHPSIRLDTYYAGDPSDFTADEQFLYKISEYISIYGFPTEAVPAPERSVELVGDEKWITDKKGKELLQRIDVWDMLQIMPVDDPLMFAVNPKMLSQTKQKHFIVENKTTYQSLLEILPQTEFSSLIYGCGNKIIKSMEQFHRQLPLPHAEHTFYYFGDMDRSGIFIWHRLHNKFPVKPAVPFYQALHTKQALEGKTNQRIDADALEAFFAFFENEASHFISVLNDGCYYPQEILTTKELQSIWRGNEW